MTGERDRALEVYSLWTGTYPRDDRPWNNKGVAHFDLGELEPALEAHLESRRLNPNNAIAHDNVASSYAGLNRLHDARVAADEAIARFPRFAVAYSTRLLIACREGDEDRVQDLLELARRTSSPEIVLTAFQCAIRTGRLADAGALQREVGDLLGESRRGLRARVLVEAAFAEWRLGSSARAHAFALEAWRLLPEHGLPPPRMLPLVAQLGDRNGVRRLTARVDEDQPNGTLFKRVWLPVTKSMQAVAANDLEGAVEVLGPVQRYERRLG